MTGSRRRARRRADSGPEARWGKGGSVGCPPRPDFPEPRFPGRERTAKATGLSSCGGI
jgi:hypothetical protein